MPNGSDKRGAQRRGIPILRLVVEEDDLQPFVLSLAHVLKNAEPGRVPHAKHNWVDQTTSPTAPEDLVEITRRALTAISRELSEGGNTRYGRIRFRRLGLVSWLMRGPAGPAGEDDADSDTTLKRELIQHEGMRRSVGYGLVLDSAEASKKLNAFVRPLYAILLYLKIHGRIPGLGVEYRWLLRQPYATPDDPGTVIGFSERLNAWRRSSDDRRELQLLLVNAFLEDLRRAYRRRPWRLRAIRRTTYVALFVSNATHENGGADLLQAINDVRNKTAAFDPLLVVGINRVSDHVGTEDAEMWPVESAEQAYRAWCRGLPANARGLDSNAWYLPIRVPRLPLPATIEGAGTQDRASAYRAARREIDGMPPLRVDQPPWWSRRWAVVVWVILILGSVAAPPLLIRYSTSSASDRRDKARQIDAAQWRATHCGLDQGNEESKALLSIGGECIGLSAHGFPFQPSDTELGKIETKIGTLNDSALAAHRANPSRAYITVAYVAAFSSTDQPPADPVSERDGLAGLAVAQNRQLDKSGSHDPLLRVLIGNAGARMKHGGEVARILSRLMADDASIVGVVGLDQSRKPTIDTIRAFTREGVPMVAATLSADVLPAVSPMYFQISPQNKREADVAAAYADGVLIRIQGRPKAISRDVRVLYSADRQDTYSNNLSSDAQSFAARGFRVDRRPYAPSPGDATAAPSPRRLGQDSCGYDGLLFFAGRPEDFRDLLDGINEHCRSNPPAILGGDDVSRYAADRDLRAQYPSVPFDYISFAIPSPSCDAKSPLYSSLSRLFPELCKGDRDISLAGHATLTYDAALSYIYAVQYLHASEVPITPASVWHGISQIQGSARIDGESGEIDFSGKVNQQVPVNKAVVILRVNGSALPTVQGMCGKLGGHQTSNWCPRPEETLR